MLFHCGLIKNNTVGLILFCL